MTGIVGINLHGVTDYGTQMPFLDMMRSARPWYAWEGQPLAQTIFDIQDVARPYIDDHNFTLTWVGSGTPILTGASDNRVSGPNQITFDWRGFLGIIKPVPDIRNLKLGRTDRLGGLRNGTLFNNDFAQFNKGRAFLRFMDWQRINNSTQVHWTDRPLFKQDTWAEGNGVPLEVCIRLCNRLKTPGWFNIPHMATDDYAIKMATMLRDRMEPTVPIYIEYSNEVWNYLFDQARYVHALLDLPGNDPDDFRKLLRGYAERSGELFQIFKRILGDRVKTVLATQTDAWACEQVLAETRADCIAITSYFGHGLQREPECLARIEAADMAVVVIDNMLWSDNNNWSIPTWVKKIKEISAVASKYGARMMIYEGGFHAQDAGIGTPKTQAAVLAYHLSDRQAQNYITMMNEWRKLPNAGPFSLYADVGPWTKDGAWTLAQTYGQLLFPAAQRIGDLADATSPWWEGKP